MGAGISALALWWALRDIEWAAVWSHISAARPLPLALAVVIATSTFFLRVFRWRLLLRRDDGTALPLPPLWHGIAIGFMANNILPFRMGEVMRALAVNRLAPVRFTSAFSSIAVERVFDGLTVVGLLVISLFVAQLPSGVEIAGVSVARIAVIGAGSMLAALAVAIAVVAWPVAAERVIRRLIPSPRLSDRLVGMVEGLRHGLSVLRSPSRLLGVIAWAVLIWTVNAFSFQAAFVAFDIPAGYATALLLQGVLVFGIAVPSTPGYVGVFEGAIKAVLLVFGVASDRAVAYAVAYHIATFFPIVLLGAWSLASTSVSLRDLRGTSAS